MSASTRIVLGMKVRDKITGVEGIAVARTEWLNGCDRICIQPEGIKDGKPHEISTFDEATCEIVGKKHPFQKPAPVFTGGPQNDPKPRPAPTR